MGQKVNVKFFTVDPYVGGTGVPRTFLEMGKIQKNIFLKIKTSIIKSEKDIYQRIHNTRFIFNFFGIFTIFFVFFPIFWKFKFHFLKKICTFSHASTAKFYYRIWFFGNFPETLGMSGSLENWATNQKLLLVVCRSVRIFFFSETLFLPNWNNLGFH